jgi:hypothetical protein
MEVDSLRLKAYATTQSGATPVAVTDALKSIDIDIPWANSIAYNSNIDKHMITLPIFSTFTEYDAGLFGNIITSGNQSLNLPLIKPERGVHQHFKVRCFHTSDTSAFVFPTGFEVHLWFEYTESRFF